MNSFGHRDGFMRCFLFLTLEIKLQRAGFKIQTVYFAYVNV